MTSEEEDCRDGSVSGKKEEMSQVCCIDFKDFIEKQFVQLDQVAPLFYHFHFMQYVY